MKAIKALITTSILVAAASVASAQDKTDSIKVYYESEKPFHHHADSLEYYIDSVLVKNANMGMFEPIQIENINIVKGYKIYITLKKDVPFNLVTFQSLGDKYLKRKKATGVIYTVDGKLVTDAEALINEKHILSISIAADQLISSLPGVKVTILKVLTRSKENIEKANTVYIRGLGSR
ncbi:MAG TPA: hypothetical protein VK541_24780 [Pedobacter sp.]|uniref:hypothetical protein n=1 Tax=Pedobacter sp. TaxID=1411316 RepID=UPI002CA21BBF|nr:hypothetical protein [Pedobacter sp.]HMI05727.1 hypothetical protein [Pedobacter sp.]